MASPFETVILKLKDLGAFEFLFPFMLTAAIFYGLLRKSQLFGKADENVAVNAIVSLVAAFMVWAYPILAGVSVQTQLSIFFFNGAIAILTIVVGLLIISMFFGPDLSTTLGSKISGSKYMGAILIMGLLIGGAILISSGLVSVFLPPGFAESLTNETTLTAIVLIVLGLTVVFIIFPGGGGK